MTISVGDRLDALSAGEAPGEQELDRLVVELMTRHDPDEIADAIESRMGMISGPAGLLVVRLIEALARFDLFHTMADYLATLPEVAPSLLWEAMNVLEGTGCIESRPALVTLNEDLDAYFDEHAAIESLVEQIEDDPDSLELILDGLWIMERESRDEILESLSRYEERPLVRDLLRRASERRQAEGLNGEA